MDTKSCQCGQPIGISVEKCVACRIVDGLDLTKAHPLECRICGPVAANDARADGSHDTECAFCHQVVRCPADRKLETEAQWALACAEGHADDCAWVLTRGERCEPKPLAVELVIEEGLSKRARRARPGLHAAGRPEQGPWVVVLVATQTGEEIIRLLEGLTLLAALAALTDLEPWETQAQRLAGVGQ